MHLSPSEEGTFCWHLSCANKRSGVSVGRLAGKMNDNSSLPRLMVSAKFIINALTHCSQTLTDSWAEQSFIDQVLAKELNIPVVTLPEQGQVSALNDPKFLDITHNTQSMSLSLSAENVERLVSSCLMHEAPCLSTHNPNIDWAKLYKNHSSLCSSLTR